MIKIKNLNKSYFDRKILNNVNLKFPTRGLIALVGVSGSGKTTLLNLIGGADKDYEGEILIDGVNLKKENDKKTANYRINNIGYVFQFFNLFELETAFNNVKLPLDSSSNVSSKIKNKRVHDVLNLVGIEHLANKNANKMSGGERQRVAIAKAIVNSPKVLLCDEPTGALDTENSILIMDLLKDISKKSLVIVSTHDTDLIRQYADEIILIQDGIIMGQKIENKDIGSASFAPILGRGKKINKSTLPLSFQISHTFRKIKSKKFRFLISNSMLSLSLVGIGLSLILSNSVSKKIENTFSSMFNGSQITMSQKNTNHSVVSNAYSASYEKVNLIKEAYPGEIRDIGAIYQLNFENFFKDKNEIYVSSLAYKYNLDGYSARLINDFIWLNDEFDKDIFPSTSGEALKNDEIVMGLTYETMKNLCFKLEILRNFESLGIYISKNDLTIALHVINNDWQYEDEQIFKVVGVVPTTKPCLYHTNPMFNKVVFEDNMRFPANDGSVREFPWEIYKIHYLMVKNDVSLLLNELMYDDRFYDYVFERVNNSFLPTLCKIGQVCDEKRIVVYYTDKSSMRTKVLKDLQNIEAKLNNYYLISAGGYASYASNLLSGFSKNLFISLDESKLVTSIDASNSINDNTLDLKLPKGVVRGNVIGNTNNVKFSSLFSNLISGKTPRNLNEIVISTGLAKLLSDTDLLNSKLYFASQISEKNKEDKNSENEYGITQVEVVGLVKEDKPYIYHNKDWTISFFRDKIGVSSFNLIPTSVIFEFDTQVDTTQLVKRLNNIYHGYVFSDPLNELSLSINNTINYAKNVLFVFSIIAIAISSLLLGTCILLNILESKKEIELYSYTGINKSDIVTSFVVEVVVQTLIAFFISAVEMIVIELVINFGLDAMFGVSSGLVLNFEPILIVFCISTFIAITIGYIVTKFSFKNKKKRRAAKLAKK